MKTHNYALRIIWQNKTKKSQWWYIGLKSFDHFTTIDWRFLVCFFKNFSNIIKLKSNKKAFKQKEHLLIHNKSAEHINTMKGDPALMQTSFVSLSEINKVEHIKEDIKEEKSVQDNGDLKEGMRST